MEALLLVIPILFVAFCIWLRCVPQGQMSLPILALAVVLIGSVFGREFFAIESGPIPLTLDRVLLAGLIGFFFLRYLRGQENIRPLNKLDILLIIWIIFITYSTVTHDWKYLKKMPASRLLFFNIMPLALYFLVRNLHIQVRDLKVIAIATGVFGIYLALTAVAEVKDIGAIVFPRYIMTSETTEFLGRGRGPFINPVSNGIFQIASFCCILMWWPRSTRLQKGMILVGAVVLAGGVYFTLTRSVWLGLIVACGWFIWIPADRQLKGGMVIIATLVGIVAFPVVAEKVFSFKRDKEVSVDEMEISAQMRPMFATVAWNMFQDKPMLGVGFGQYGQTKHPYLRDPRTGRPLTITKSLMQHNVFLAYVTETGLVGLGILCLILLGATIICWEIWNNKQLHLLARQFGLLGLVIISNYAINGMFHDVSIIPQMHMLMFALFGIANNIHTNQYSVSLVHGGYAFQGGYNVAPRPVANPVGAGQQAMT